MREVDRIAMEDVGLGILQMMENAGRNLAENAWEMLAATTGEVMVLAGGGGLCCARHLHNRGFQVNVILDREPTELGKACPGRKSHPSRRTVLTSARASVAGCF